MAEVQRLKKISQMSVKSAWGDHVIQNSSGSVYERTESLLVDEHSRKFLEALKRPCV